MPPCPHRASAADGPCPACAALDRLACGACGQAMPDDSRFCAACGARLAPRSGALALALRAPADDLAAERAGEPAGERKPVSILFVNAYGSFDLSASFDPEEWHRILCQFFDILGAGVRRHGGVVERLTGEGIKARFGAPVAHERHALQACEAALSLAGDLAAFGRELRRVHGVSFSARMGIHSGDALYGPLGASGAMTSSAQGYTAALASRMEQLAEPGTICCTDETARLVRDDFDLEDLGLFTIRGLRDPLRVFRLVGQRHPPSRIEAGRARGFTRFVGRQRELEALLDVVATAERNREARSVCVFGEPGIGKTRLAEELARVCAERGAIVRRFTSVERERLVPFGFARRFSRTVLDIREHDDLQAAREKAAGKLVLLDPELRDALAVTFDMLGVAQAEATSVSGHDARVRQIASMIQRLLDAPRHPVPQIFVFDDRHWTDDATEAVTRAFFEVRPASPMVAVMLCRPGYHRSWMDRDDSSSITLEPFTPAESRELVATFLGTDPSVEGLIDDLIDRGGGNPFFLEESLRALVENGSLVGAPGAYRLAAGTAARTLPDSLHALLVSRIDALSPREKLVVQAAAVLGTPFEEPILRRALALSPAEMASAIEELRSSDLVWPAADGTPGSYQFRHPLMTESVRRSLHRAHRASLHARAAEAIAAEAGAGANERAAQLAEHWEGANNPLEAARWHRRAATWAARRDPHRALAHWRSLRSFSPALGNDDAYRRHLLEACVAELELAWFHGITPEEAAARHAEGRRIASDLGDLRTLARLSAGLADVVAIFGDFERAILLGHEACAHAARTDDPHFEVAMRTRLAATLFETGDLRPTIATCRMRARDRALSSSTGLGYDPLIQLRITRGALALDLGHPRTGRRLLEDALAEARRIDDRFSICIATSALAAVPRLTGDLPPYLLASSREAVALAEAIGSRRLQAATRTGLGMVAHYAGRPEEARRILEDTLGILGSAGLAHGSEPTIHSLLGPVCLSCGDSQAAVAYARKGLDAVREGPRRLREIDATLRWARVSITVGADPRDAIVSTLERALALALATRARSRTPRVLCLLGFAHLAHGDADAARDPLGRALRLFERLGAAGEADAVRLALAGAPRPDPEPPSFA